MSVRRSVALFIAAVALCFPQVGSAEKKGTKNPASEDSEKGGASDELDGREGELEEAAKEGDARSQFLLGIKYFQGDGVERDAVKAAELFRLAADQGLLPASYSLGLLYLDGDGVKQSDKEAAAAFLEAADFGYGPAQTMLGSMFEDGRGVEQDHAQAFKWYRRASWQDEPQAQASLGYLYSLGKGVERDLRKSAEFYHMSATAGFAPAQATLGQIFYEGKGVKQNFETAREWYKKSADQGDLWGRNNLAWLLATCEDESIRNGEESVEVAKAAIEEGGAERFEIMDTYAASLARKGDFKEAEKVQKQALSLLGKEEDIPPDEQKELTRQFEERLELYRKKEPYVEPAPEPEDEPEEDPDFDKPNKDRVVA